MTLAPRAIKCPMKKFLSASLKPKAELFRTSHTNNFSLASTTFRILETSSVSPCCPKRHQFCNPLRPQRNIRKSCHRILGRTLCKPPANSEIADTFPFRRDSDETGLRRRNLEKFSFHILFEELDDRIRIQVVRHHSRKPTFGTKRSWD